MTTDYYDEHSEQFAAATESLSMATLYQRFLPLVRMGGVILDAGCGSGRDAREFQLRGFSVVAFDASPAMAKLASERLGQPVQVMRFQDMTFHACFDGIWTCASLLHVPRSEMADVFRRIETALRPKGAWFMAFKRGHDERIATDGRLFNDYTAERLRADLGAHDSLAVAAIWESSDLRADREDTWVNCVAIRK